MARDGPIAGRTATGKGSSERKGGNSRGDWRSRFLGSASRDDGLADLGWDLEGIRGSEIRVAHMVEETLAEAVTKDLNGLKLRGTKRRLGPGAEFCLRYRGEFFTLRVSFLVCKMGT